MCQTTILTARFSSQSPLKCVCLSSLLVAISPLSQIFLWLLLNSPPGLVKARFVIGYIPRLAAKVFGHSWLVDWPPVHVYNWQNLHFSLKSTHHHQVFGRVGIGQSTKLASCSIKTAILDCLKSLGMAQTTGFWQTHPPSISSSLVWYMPIASPTFFVLSLVVIGIEIENPPRHVDVGHIPWETSRCRNPRAWIVESSTTST